MYDLRLMSPQLVLIAVAFGVLLLDLVVTDKRVLSWVSALGLVAAIPAVLAFNKLNNDITRYSNRLEAFAGEFGAILSRQLEEKH